MFTLPTEPQSSFKLLQTVFQFWKTHYAQLVLIVLASIIWGALPGILVPHMTTLSFDFVRANIGMAAIVGIIYMSVIYLLFAFILCRIDNIMYDKQATIPHSLLQVLKNLPYLFITFLIYYLSTFLGLLVLIIPGIAMQVLLSMAYPLTAVDNEKPFSAVKKSWQLVTPYFWHTFMILFTVFIGIILASLLINSIGTHLFMLAHPAGFGKLPIGHTVLKLILDMIFFPFYASMLIMLLHDLKLRQAAAQ